MSALQLSFPLIHRTAVKAAVLSVMASAGCGAASAATVSQSVEVQGNPSAIWAWVGPFCAIRDWLPPVGTCSQDAATPQTRTLVTKDGKATFVERQTARDDAKHFYTYTFLASPLPVREYSSTISVTPNGDGKSTVTWRGTYTPVAGQESAAQDALAGIYAAGLGEIQAQARQRATVADVRGAP